jgi:hypothetical protein
MVPVAGHGRPAFQRQSRITRYSATKILPAGLETESRFSK